MQEFIDPSYLSNKRPAIPGGSWPKELLRKKSFADLQQLWFALVKEKNMLATTKHHYFVHQEELGAFPAPNRVEMVDQSMLNIKAVVQERDFEATDKAVAIFKERLKAGIYRYPPGPQPPADYGLSTSLIQITFSKKVNVERIRELFGKYDVYEPHRGISKITQTLSEAAESQKKQAEAQWSHYMLAKRSYEGYHAFDGVESLFDESDVELAPGVFGANSTDSSVRAADVEVPERLESNNDSLSVLESLKKSNQRKHLAAAINYKYYPIMSTQAPEEPPARPVHPDEIEGPWIVTIEYDKPDGFGYAMGLEVNSIDGAKVLKIEEISENKNFAARCPIYQEAKSLLKADEANTHNWPHIPTWKSSYNTYSRKKLDDIIMYNYSNVVDYVDREVLLTGKSSWELPIKIDPSCGGGFNVPAHAKPNDTRYRAAKFRRM